MVNLLSASTCEVSVSVFKNLTCLDHPGTNPSCLGFALMAVQQAMSPALWMTCVQCASQRRGAGQ
jgi:hypothetical protein